MKPNEYQCAICKGIFEKVLTDEEAKEQLLEEFGDYDVEDCDLVCDDCYNEHFGHNEIYKEDKTTKNVGEQKRSLRRLKTIYERFLNDDKYAEYKDAIKDIDYNHILEIENRIKDMNDDEYDNEYRYVTQALFDLYYNYFDIGMHKYLSNEFFTGMANVKDIPYGESINFETMEIDEKIKKCKEIEKDFWSLNKSYYNAWGNYNVFDKKDLKIDLKH